MPGGYTSLIPAFMCSGPILSITKGRSHQYPILHGFVKCESHRTRVQTRFSTVGLPCCSASPTPTALPSTVVTHIDPRTSSTIHVVGCVHGSYLSAADVQHVLTTTCPDVVVLELCDSRLEALRKTVFSRKPNERLVFRSKNTKKPAFRQIVRKFKGTPQAILAILLEGAYKLQVFSGLDPGIEFDPPIRNYYPSNIVCGDAPARDTIQNLYRVFLMPLESVWISWSTTGSIFQSVFWPPKGGINLLAILFNPVRVRELSRLIFSAAVVGIAFFALGNAASFAVRASPIAFSIPATSKSEIWSAINVTLESLFALYIFVTSLHFLKVLIVDRDVIITKSLIDTVRLQAREKNRPVTVCAVVGLLHVNGILSKLREQMGQ